MVAQTFAIIRQFKVLRRDINISNYYIFIWHIYVQHNNYMYTRTFAIGWMEKHIKIRTRRIVLKKEKQTYIVFVEAHNQDFCFHGRIFAQVFFSLNY